MKRRAFLVALSCGFFGAAGPSRAQRAGVRRVGVLTSGAAAAEQRRFDDFAQGLRELGYVEGANVEIERRFAEGRFDALPALAGDLVQRNVEVIMCMSTLATQAAKDATRTIPIVFATVADPVGEGFVQSLARPGGNITGLSTTGTELSGKGLQLLKEAFPTLSRVGVLTAPRAPHAAANLAELTRAAGVLGVAVLPVRLHRRDDVDGVRARLADWRADALYVMQGAENSAARPLLVQFSAEARLPAIYPQRNYVEAGGLMSYGPSYDANYRRAATYVDRILKGAKPADLPVEQPTRYELAINARTARTLGFALPDALVLRADEVIR
jgi:putative tryptophan/tyrosine transport system substrate-binding protein